MKKTCSRVLLLLLSFIFSWHITSSAGLAEGSLIATVQGPVPIQDLKVGDRVISYKTDGSLVQAAVTKVLQHRTDSLFCLYITPQKFIIASPHQLFYDPHNGFIEAQYITNKNTITSIFPYSFQVWKTSNTYVSPKNTLMSLDVYSIEIEYPHTYFVSDSSFCDNEEALHTFLLTHNGLPALGIGCSVVLEKTLTTLAFSKASVFAGGLGLTAGPTGLIIGGMAGLSWVGYNLFFKKDKAHQNRVYIEQADRTHNKGPEGPQDPKDPNKRIINTITKAEFFRQVKDQYEHWKNQVYMLKTRAEGLLNGKAHYLQWDHRHNDVEVYDKAKNHLGSLDPKTLKLYKGPVPFRDMGD